MERAISLLKGRWRKLKYLNYLDLELGVQIIMAAWVLHNFCLIHDDFDDNYFLPDEGDSPQDDENNFHDIDDGAAVHKRQHLLNILFPL